MFNRQNGSMSQANGASPQPRIVPAVEKAFRLLDCLAGSGEPLGISELARRLGMGKSTVHGLTGTLEALGVIDAVGESRRFRIGRGLHVLATRSSGSIDLRAVARASLEALADTTGQTAFLGMPHTDTVTIVDCVHGRPAMSISAPIGSSVPLLAGAVGKALLATWPLLRREAYVTARELPRFTRRTLVDRARYLKAVERAAQRGYAIDVDEYVDGMRAAAAAIVGADDEPVGVVWVAGFARHIDEAALDAIAASVSAAAKAIASQI
jgi:IclR family transcriptional regulator, KDG regulon repressor